MSRPRFAASDVGRTPEQRRAAHALSTVNALEADERVRQKYRAYVERIGPAILANGLGQALASERAAATNQPRSAQHKAHHRLYANLHAWLSDSRGVYASAPDLLQAIVTGDEPDYLRAQAEALAWLVWHKKFCRAYLPRPDTSDADDSSDQEET
ncbi:MAG: type III-B CRISPR module-associated protein Cmr5 [Labilithrix sp.]|nr:type III-B CRISPR module-associated protein Cmr5 [Labilithrix sp.]